MQKESKECIRQVGLIRHSNETILHFGNTCTDTLFAKEDCFVVYPINHTVT